MKKINAIRGAKDITPESSPLWRYVEELFARVSGEFCYEEIRTPIFEKTELFARGIGEGADVVNKEMYTFDDRGGESITLRPEMTASVARSVMEHTLLRQGALLRLWYFGPFFRYERPQKGRLRQFHQYGAECVGSPNPESDAEIISLAENIIGAIGIKDYKLLLNTIGNDSSRAEYRKALVEYLSTRKSELSEDSLRRLETNPLRILDSKSESDIAVCAEAPLILDYLDEESSRHFESVKQALDACSIDYEIQPLLARGLDYYSHTVFEFQSDALGAQDSFGGGGRYDGLFRQIGGKESVPAVGFAMGVERMLLILEETGRLPLLDNSPRVYVIAASDALKSKALQIANSLRARRIKTNVDLLGKSIKAQFRESNKNGVKYAIIVGEDELSRGAVQIKNMDEGDAGEINLVDLDGFDFH